MLVRELGGFDLLLGTSVISLSESVGWVTVPSESSFIFCAEESRGRSISVQVRDAVGMCLMEIFESGPGMYTFALAVCSALVNFEHQYALHDDDSLSNHTFSDLEKLDQAIYQDTFPNQFLCLALKAPLTKDVCASLGLPGSRYSCMQMRILLKFIRPAELIGWHLLYVVGYCLR